MSGRRLPFHRLLDASSCGRFGERILHALTPHGRSSVSLPEVPRVQPRTATERLQLWLILGLSLVLLTMAVLSARIAADSTHSTQLHARGYRNLETLHELFLLLKEAELAQRNYLLSGDGQLLDRYHALRQQIDHQF
jgi:hypothetical protein